MSGIQEILLLVLIFLGIFFVPRLIQRNRPAPAIRRINAPKRSLVSGRARAGIAFSLIWLLAAAAYLEPWRDRLLPFVYAGAGPVALAWLIVWVRAGFQKH